MSSKEVTKEIDCPTESEQSIPYPHKEGTKQYEKGMIENGYFKLACGNWSDGAQCMCDICYGI